MSSDAIWSIVGTSCSTAAAAAAAAFIVSGVCFCRETSRRHEFRLLVILRKTGTEHLGDWLRNEDIRLQCNYNGRGVGAGTQQKKA